MSTKFYKLSLFILFTTLSISSKAEIIIAIANKGFWNESSTWDLDRLPKSGDTIYIPSGIEVNINENINFERHGFKSQEVTLTVSGIVSFKNGKSLNLSENSTVIVNQHGQLSKRNLQKKLNSFISIHLIKIWDSKQGKITGPIILGKEVIPSQEISDFEVVNFKDTFFVSWNIKQFQEAGYYDLMVSKTGKNWESIKKMKALHSDSIEKFLGHVYQASKTDENLYFRLDVCDLNGKTSILATASAKRKVDHSEALETIPKLLITYTFMTFINRISKYALE